MGHERSKSAWSRLSSVLTGGRNGEKGTENLCANTMGETSITVVKTVTSLETQIKTTMRYHPTPGRMAVPIESTNTKCSREAVEKREASYTGGGNVGWDSPCGKQYDASSENSNESYHMIQPGHPPLGACPDKTILQKDTRIPMSVRALFTTAKAWKKPRRP